MLRLLPVLFALVVTSLKLSAANLTAGTPTITLTCTKGTACSSKGTSTLAISAGTGYYAVTSPSVPWVQVTPLNGLATTTAGDNTLTFAASPAWTTLGSGLYTTTVTIASPGHTSATVTVKLQVNDAATTLQVRGGIGVLNPVPYTVGGTTPTMAITLLSSSSLPISFTTSISSAQTPAGVPAGWLTHTGTGLTTSNGIAYSWGTTLNFTPSTAALSQATAGDVLTGSVTITPAGGAAIILPVSIAVNAGTATVTQVTPPLVPLLSGTVPPGAVTMVLRGTNFVATTGSQKTKVFLGTSQISPDNVTVLSPTYLTVSIPYDNTGGVFKTAGATALVFGVNNSPTGTAAVGSTVSAGVTAAPIISTITSSSAYVAPVGSANPKASPYDIISIFGFNFCPLCTGSNSILVGAADATYGRYPTTLIPNPTATTTNKIQVTFSKPGTPATLLPGYLLFATNNQINVLVPGNLTSLTTSGAVNVQVGYDTAVPAAANNTSAAFAVDFAAKTPGIFTISSNGQGDGAITDSTTFALNTQAASAVAGTDTVAIFMTGLGIPDSAGTNIATGSPVYGTNCLAPLGAAGTSGAAPLGYLGTVLTPASVTSGPYVPGASYVAPTWTSIDGAVIRTAILQGNYPPCFINASKPTVTIGGQAATVSYAGFVGDAIAGLYQVNALVPAGAVTNAGTPEQVAVVVTHGAIASQSGVTMWVQ
ncbi:MAG: hypothetical protein NTZ56_19950 [Acidobacteria bacterium]|nr:hypothetical protein [Acidobacteriota bacterium]